MSLLTVVQQFCDRTNITAPQSVMSSSDPQIKQVKALLEEEGKRLRTKSWQTNTFEASHTTLNQEDQGAITSIATNGFNYIVNQTIWDRTETLPVLGPMSASEWQQLKAVFLTGPRYRFRIRGNRLLVNPAPPAGHNWFFEYVSKNWILNGATYKEVFTQDSDEILFPEEVVLLGLRWRWLSEKGFDYSEVFRDYEERLKDELGFDGGKEILCMDDYERSQKPGVFVPQWSWPL